MVLVTGHRGFIGLHLTRRFDAIRTRWIGVDRKPDAGRNGIVADVRDLTPASLARLGITEIIHLAAPVGVASTSRHPDRARNEIIAGTRAVCDLAVAFDAPLLFVSSSEIYGETGGVIGPMTSPAPLSGYAKGKLEAESMVRDSVARYVILRPFNVYGAGQRRGFFVANLLSNLLADIPVSLVDRGAPIRHFTYVRDLVEAVDRIRAGGYGGHTALVAGPEPLSLLQATEIGANVLGVKPKLCFVSASSLGRARRFEVRTRRVDHASLGARPGTPFAEGIALTVADAEAFGFLRSAPADRTAFGQSS